MKVCIDCLSVEQGDAAFCGHCGHNEFGRINRNGYIVALPGAAGLPCQHCLEEGRDLKFRYYRYVVALVFWAQIGGTAGYFCRSCRWKTLGYYMSSCLVLGWWAITCFFFHNPVSIVINSWAMFSSPLNASELGALDLEDVARAAEEEEDFADMYASMPSWIDSLDPNEIDLVLADVDYYGVLGISQDASSEVVKSAWREQVKIHHPDTAAENGRPELMPVINDAHTVLSDERIRYAYDRRHDLLDAVSTDDFGGETEEEEEDLAGLDFGCRICSSAWPSEDALDEHIKSRHRLFTYEEVYVPLVDGVPVHPGNAAHHKWQCRTCGQRFDNYEVALDHASDAHPDRIALDPRSVLEKVEA